MIHLNSILSSCISQLQSTKNLVDTQKNTTRHKKRLSERVWRSQDLTPYTNEDELVSHIKNKNATDRTIINDLMYLDSLGKPIRVSQSWMGERADISLRHTNRLMATLKDERIADTYTRGMEMTAITRLTPMLARPSIWVKLQHVLPVCASLAQGFILFAGLLSSPKAFSKWANVVGLKNNYLYINKEYKKNIPVNPKGIKEEPKTEPPKVAATAEEAKRIIDAFLATLG